MKYGEKDQALRVLQAAEWLKDFPSELAESLLADGRLLRLNVGEWAQAEGDDRGGLFVVIGGLLHSFCTAPGEREVMIGLTGAGALLGHATRFSGGPRLVTAVCVEPTVLLEISEGALDRIAEQQPEIWRAIAGFSYANMRRAVQMAAEAISLPPRARIAARLLAAADALHSQAPGSTQIVPLSQELLGEMTGVTRKTVNHHLSAFQRDGLIELGYGRIRLCDIHRLQTVANGS